MHKYIPLLLLLSSCSYSINQIHTKGTAKDVVDENQTPTADLNVPLKLTNGPSSPIHQEPHGLNGPMQPIS